MDNENPMRTVTLGFVLAMVMGSGGVAVAQEDFIVLKHFINESEGSPRTGLTQATDGNLYGAVTGGGIYRWTRDGTYARISEAASSFDLIQGRDGYLYGNTQSRIYRIALTGEFTQLAVFGDASVDGRMVGPLVEGDDGNLYGIARIASFAAAARIFRVTPAGEVSTAHQFAAIDHPEHVDYNRMIKGRDGYFYGTTWMGGRDFHGTIFRFHPDGSFLTLHTFTGFAGGSRPQAPLVETADGTFYGTTGSGGIGNGTIFRFRPGAEFTVIHAFQEIDGSFGPRTQLTPGSDGHLYGASEDALFRVSAAGEFRVLHRTTGLAAAKRWGLGFQRLIQWFDGNFYGTGRFWGAESGVLFRLNRERSACTNELELTLTGGIGPTLLINHVAKTETAAVGGLFFVSQYEVRPIWFGVMAPVTPAVAYELPLWLSPGVGTVGVFSFVATSGGQTCSDWTTVETGGPAIDAGTLQRHTAEYLSSFRSWRE
jgi:uncharacterized repeat protein (TIGR03803 family)